MVTTLLENLTAKRKGIKVTTFTGVAANNIMGKLLIRYFK